MGATRELDITKSSGAANALAAKFADRIIGQDEAKSALIDLLNKFTSGMYNKEKPIGSLLFLGPTGTGKTLVAETFAEGLFGSPKNMLKVDCAEFQHSHEIAKLIGSPPGYLGHRETSPYFTNVAMMAARCNVAGKEVLPFTIVLFDEIEKASDALWNLLLGILDKGSLTTGTNERVDMTKSVILMTSNIGAAQIANENALGFQGEAPKMDDARIAEIARSAAKRKFLPEFLNRLDTIVNFRSLTKADLKEILEIELTKLEKRILFDSHVIFDLQVSPPAKAQLIEEGYEKRYNARHLVRAVDQRLTTPLTRLISTGQIKDTETVVVSYSKAKDKWAYEAHP